MSESLLCTMSGRAPTDEEYPEDLDAFAEEEDMEPLPVGWIRVRVERLGINPAWVTFQQRKANALDLAKMSANSMVGDDTPDEIRRATIDAMIFVSEAQLVAAEATIPRYVVIREDVVISPPEADPEMLDVWAGIGEALGLSAPGIRMSDADGDETADEESSDDPTTGNDD